jgi:hypothetical protein
VTPVVMAMVAPAVTPAVVSMMMPVMMFGEGWARGCCMRYYFHRLKSAWRCKTPKTGSHQQ